MTSVIINAVLVGIAAWLSTELWHITGLGLVISIIAVYVAARFVLGFVLIFLSESVGRPRDKLIWF